MHDKLIELAKTFILLFAIVDPFGSVPLFLAITPGEEDSHRRRMAGRACLISFAVLAFFALAGRLALNFFNIDVPAFAVAGGLVLAMMSLPMLSAFRGGLRIRESEEEEVVHREDVSIIPLTFPILAGPGAITTVLVLTQNNSAPAARVLVIACAAVVLLISYLVLAASSRIARALGTTGLNVVTRIMGLIILVLAVQFILSGIKTFFGIQ